MAAAMAASFLPAFQVGPWVGLLRDHHVMLALTERVG